MKSSGITWTDKYLFAYLVAPSKVIPGNKMSFAGLPGEKDRANLIAYLKTTSS
jgi:cytochrome c